MYDEIIDWMVDLLAETIHVKEDANIFKSIFNTAEIEKKLKKGMPAYDNGSIPVDVNQACKTYFSLVEKTEKNLGKSLGGLKKILADSKSKAGQLFTASLKQDSQTLRLLCKDHGVDPHVARLLLRIALRPSLKKTALKTAEEFDLTKWPHGHCPVCGSAPTLARIGGEGEGRTLFCSLCETSWAYPRLRCPFCENDRQEDLHYVYSENEVGIRMDICNRCKGNLKTFDSHYPSEVIIPALDNLVTSHLDMATEKL
jgi:FdhE protein